MNAAKWDEEQEAKESSVVVMTNAVVDPRAVMVHFGHTPAGKVG